MFYARFILIISIASQISYGRADPGYATTPAKPTYFTPPESVTLKWTVLASVAPVVIILHKYDPAYGTYDYYVEYIVPQKKLIVYVHQSRIDMYNQTIFRINNTVANDAGRYKCVLNTGTQIFESIIDLVVDVRSTSSSQQQYTQTASWSQLPESKMATQGIESISSSGVSLSSSDLAMLDTTRVTPSYTSQVTRIVMSTIAYPSLSVFDARMSSRLDVASSRLHGTSSYNERQSSTTAIKVIESSKFVSSSNMASSNLPSASVFSSNIVTTEVQKTALFSLPSSTPPSHAAGILNTLAGTSLSSLALTSRSDGARTTSAAITTAYQITIATLQLSSTSSIFSSTASQNSRQATMAPSTSTFRQSINTSEITMTHSKSINPLRTTNEAILPSSFVQSRMTSSLQTISLTGINSTVTLMSKSTTSISATRLILLTNITSSISTTSLPKSSNVDSQKRNAIIGVAVGAILTGLIIFTGVVYFLKKKRMSHMISPS